MSSGFGNTFNPGTFGGGTKAPTATMRSQMTPVGEGISAAGGIIGAYGAIEQGQETASALGFQASADQTNAQEALQAGQYNVLEQQIMAHRQIGTMNATFGASGVSNMGSSAQAEIASAASESELDRLNLLHQADLQATNYQNQATADQMAAENAVTGSYYQALGSLVQSGAMIATAVG